MPCPDENTIAGYIQRRLSDADAAHVEEHLGACAGCRAVVSDLVDLFGEPADLDGPAELAMPADPDALVGARRSTGQDSRPSSGADAASSSAPSSPSSDADEPLVALPLVPGDSIGRYILLRKVGSGGFGIVYAAYDPRLDRKIALKVLRASRLGPRDTTHEHERLLREAQAMARLSHPNVTSVYDVAAFGERIAVAMEFIDGADARAWLHKEPRAWREILRVFLQAGRGLAAAHAAGIVHRDFKPANVLIGHDGRVSVTDFGLARLDSLPLPGGGGQGGQSDAPRPAQGARTTHAGALLGTPAYMAPEQQKGLRATAKSDQFSFAVALHEALAGGRRDESGLPTEGVPARARARAGDDELSARERADSAREPRAARLSSPPRGSAPAWILRALSRALEPDPERRFPSMDELLAALSPEQRSQRRRLIIAIAAVALLTIVPLARLYDLRRAEAEACTGAAQKVAEVWSAERREQVRAAFAASGQPYAKDSWSSVERALSAYMSRWSVIFTESCEATRRGEQSEEVLTARMLCLEERRAEVETLASELSAGNEQAVLNAVRSASSLSDLETCGRTAELLTQPPPPSSARMQVEDMRLRLGQVRALRNSGHVERAFELSEQILTKAREIDYAPLLSEALLLVARGHVLGGRMKEAEATLYEAVRAAGRGRNDRVAAEAWIELVFLIGTAGRRDAVGLELRHAAAAALDRLGGDKRLEAKLASSVGLILAYRGRYTDALAEQQRALKLLTESAGAAAPEAGSQWHRIAEILREMGRCEEAREAALHSADVIAQAYGRRHPMSALPLVILADSECARGQYDACTKLARDAAAVRAMASTPADHPSFLPMLLVLAKGLSGAGRSREALTELERAERIATAAFGASDSWVGLARSAAGDALFAAGAFEEAAAKHREAAALFTQALGPDHPDVAAARDSLGRALRALGRFREALAEHEQALAVRTKTFGEESPMIAASLLGIGDCYYALGRRADAEASARRALALAARGSPELLAEARFFAARVGGDRQLAVLARDHWSSAAPPRRDRVLAVSQWLDRAR